MENEPAKYPVKNILIGVASVLLLIIFYQFISSPMVITVTGTGSVSSPAETATLTFSMTSNSDSPNNAVNDLKSKIERTKETLKTSGIPGSDIYESQITVYPASLVTTGAGGYQAMTSMGLRTTNVTSLDSTILNLYSLGATVVAQPVLEVGEKEQLNKDAFNLALKDAKGQIGSIALRNLKLIRKIVLIQETTSPTSSTVTTNPSITEQVENNLAPETGLIKVTKVLNVTYKLW